MSPSLNWPKFTSTPDSTLLRNIITANITGYTIAIVALHSVDIATASYML